MTETQHVITVTPETLGDEPAAPDLGWRWLPRPDPVGGVWYRPSCSCGWRSKSVYTAEHRAERAGQIHIAVNTPRREAGRYWAQVVANVEDQSWSIQVWCQQHRDQPLTTVPAEGHEDEIQEAIRDHDWQYHDDDRVA